MGVDRLWEVSKEEEKPVFLMQWGKQINPVTSLVQKCGLRKGVVGNHNHT